MSLTFFSSGSFNQLEDFICVMLCLYDVFIFHHSTIFCFLSQIQSLQDTIKQLENERGQMYENLKEQRQLSDRLGIQIADLNEELIRKSRLYA